MTREQLLRSREYWTTQIQNSLFQIIHRHLKENNLTKTELANQLGVTKGYISQILAGDFDHKISKLVELALACDKAPLLHFCDINEYLADDKAGRIGNRHLRPIHYEININAGAEVEVEPGTVSFNKNIKYEAENKFKKYSSEKLEALS